MCVYQYQKQGETVCSVYVLGTQHQVSSNTELLEFEKSLFAQTYTNKLNKHRK